MKSDFKLASFHGNTVPLMELCHEITDCHHSTPKWTAGGKMVIRNFNIKGGRLHLNDLSYTDEKTFKERTGRSKPQAGDLIITREAPMGEVCIIPEGVECCLGQRMVLIKPNKEKVDVKYLLYALQSEFVQKQIQKSDKTGSIVSNLRIPVLKELQIPNFDSIREKNIGSFLDSIVTKIELNYKINTELETMAKLIYDYWFVQFDFPNAKGKPYKSSGGKMVWNDELKREIPEGWELVPIEYYANVIDPHPSHRAPKEVETGFPFAGIGDIDTEGNINLSKARVIDEEFVLKQERDYSITEYSLGYGRVGTVGKVVKLKKQSFRFALSPTMAVINPKDEIHAGYIFNCIRDPFFYKMVLKNTSGTTRPAIGIQLLRKIPVLKPASVHKKMFEKFEVTTKQFLKKAAVLNKETQSLVQLRDWLLPMLMNGQVKVGDAKQELAMAAEPSSVYKIKAKKK